MPTEEYVGKQFDDGMAVEIWLETLIRDNLKDVKVVKRRDVSVRPHKHEDIKDIPSSPDLTIFLKEGQEVKVWVTHKKMRRSKWIQGRNRYIDSMYWRYKTYMSIETGEYLAYCIFDSLEDFGVTEVKPGDATSRVKYVKSPPQEVLWMKYTKDTYRGQWRDYSLPDQDDLRAKIDMSQAKVIYKEGRLLISKLVEVL